tara:strand:+ start:792 stop:1676 length:885 start_codon:yes stop_codon:yes gene_type:complete
MSAEKHKLEGNLANCLIIGAQKCATSSLFHYLSFHPNVIASAHKELNFFNEELCWDKGLNWYKSNFVGKAKIYLEASPSYTNYPLYKGVAKRMHSLIPQAKLIYIVRDPIERLISQYLDRVKGGQETLAIEDAFVEGEDSVYIDFSKYYMQLEQFLNYYPKESFLILTAEELKNKRRETLKRAFRFLNIDDDFYCDEFSDLINVSRGKLKRKKPRRIVRYFAHGPKKKTSFSKLGYAMIPKILKDKALESTKTGQKVYRPLLSEDLRNKLIEALRADIAKLREFSGCSFSQWCL